MFSVSSVQLVLQSPALLLQYFTFTTFTLQNTRLLQPDGSATAVNNYHVTLRQHGNMSLNNSCLVCDSDAMDGTGLHG